MRLEAGGRINENRQGVDRVPDAVVAHRLAAPGAAEGVRAGPQQGHLGAPSADHSLLHLVDAEPEAQGGCHLLAVQARTMDRVDRPEPRMVRRGLAQVSQAPPIVNPALVESALALSLARMPVQDANQPAHEGRRRSGRVLDVSKTCVFHEESFVVAALLPSGAWERVATTGTRPPLREECRRLGRGAADLSLRPCAGLLTKRPKRRLVALPHLFKQRTCGKNSSTGIRRVHVPDQGQGGCEAGHTGWQRDVACRPEAQATL